LYAALQRVLENEEARIHMPKPVILKPYKLWTGKQLITAILKSLTINHKNEGMFMQSKCKISDSLWGLNEGEESGIIVRDNQFLTGIMDKS